ncbi:MAG: allophanate hydrolase [Piscirickettsiaceae bacterium CG_4_9_14_0_2_um_filter_44_546]|nr:MAG: allophanate hydrolase [Thiomicrospira sp. CG2_30_44_34]PIW58346.1 MAG: allophanate hydrolase [Piscirickettsiaceae bacterium CG12_big_fil_rev_8_21_14_0_65_44_934]PIW77132.1 MAG: allophanate hydrolase [Piscirickettsiaceae bacterium CG_4_8_14_3_um_filter_44_38]PJC34979.1 MAG: allophanate hydrolase [Piscirickettsiaceae bacterium CG_4_9_14_0_2_um_filter_44_546]
MTTQTQQDLRIPQLQAAYASGKLSPRQLMTQLSAEAEKLSHYNMFIHLLTAAEREPYLQTLEATEVNSLPLWGIPFVIKDNIDLAGIPTTAACKAFSYEPESSAAVVQTLIDAGAIPLGKSNLDQFATGLVGTRSPYGVCHNAFDFDMISGGSSAGSAVSLALNLCSFSLGTDTAGSGRVPAAFNNLIGLKPSKGLLSTSGVVPAVRSQDVVSIFALNAQDAQQVFKVAAQYDANDEYARPASELTPPVWNNKPVLGIPDPASLDFCNDPLAEKQFHQTIQHLVDMGYDIQEIDFTPWLDTAKLLYEGAWVAERYVAIEDFFNAHETQLDPTVGKIIAGARSLSAAQAYKGAYALQKAQRLTQSLWQTIDCMITPTTPSIFSIAQLQADPIGLNSALGTYTNFMNLLDYAAVAVPTGFREDKLPTGITVFAPAGTDTQLLKLADIWQNEFVTSSGAQNTPIPAVNTAAFPDSQTIPLAVVGAHLTGFPLNHHLLERGAKLMQTTQTAPKYAFYELASRPILKPGLVKIETDNDQNIENGVSIEVEVWAMPKQHLGSFLALIPSPLGLGKVELIDGSEVVGFICEPIGIQSAKNISHSGGWRNWMKIRS